MTKALVIGVGSAGIEVLNHLQQKLNDLRNPHYSSVEMLGLYRDDAELPELTALGATQLLQLTQEPSTSDVERFQHSVPHIPSEETLFVYSRLYGRLLFDLEQKTIQQRISEMYNEVRNRSNIKDEIAVPQNNDVQVYIIGSLSNNTFTGMILPLSVVLNSMKEPNIPTNHHLFLLAPSDPEDFERAASDVRSLAVDRKDAFFKLAKAQAYATLQELAHYVFANEELNYPFTHNEGSVRGTNLHSFFRSVYVIERSNINGYNLSYDERSRMIAEWIRFDIEFDLASQLNPNLTRQGISSIALLSLVIPDEIIRSHFVNVGTKRFIHEFLLSSQFPITNRKRDEQEALIDAFKNSVSLNVGSFDGNLQTQRRELSGPQNSKFDRELETRWYQQYSVNKRSSFRHGFEEGVLSIEYEWRYGIKPLFRRSTSRYLGNPGGDIKHDLGLTNLYHLFSLVRAQLKSIAQEKGKEYDDHLTMLKREQQRVKDASAAFYGAFLAHNSLEVNLARIILVAFTLIVLFAVVELFTLNTMLRLLWVPVALLLLAVGGLIAFEWYRTRRIAKEKEVLLGKAYANLYSADQNTLIKQRHYMAALHLFHAVRYETDVLYNYRDRLTTLYQKIDDNARANDSLGEQVKRAKTAVERQVIPEAILNRELTGMEDSFFTQWQGAAEEYKGLYDSAYAQHANGTADDDNIYIKMLSPNYNIERIEADLSAFMTDRINEVIREKTVAYYLKERNVSERNNFLDTLLARYAVPFYVHTHPQAAINQGKIVIWEPTSLGAGYDDVRQEIHRYTAQQINGKDAFRMVFAAHGPILGLYEISRFAGEYCNLLAEQVIDPNFYHFYYTDVSAIASPLLDDPNKLVLKPFSLDPQRFLSARELFVLARAVGCVFYEQNGGGFFKILTVDREEIRLSRTAHASVYMLYNADNYRDLVEKLYASINAKFKRQEDILPRMQDIKRAYSDVSTNAETEVGGAKMTWWELKVLSNLL